MSFDLYPTFVAAAGGSVPRGTQLSGTNLLPFVDGSRASGSPHDVLFWKAEQGYAVRWGEWKLGKHEVLPERPTGVPQRLAQVETPSSCLLLGAVQSAYRHRSVRSMPF